jgi:hypothetical protein
MQPLPLSDCGPSREKSKLAGLDFDLVGLSRWFGAHSSDFDQFLQYC